MFVKVKYLGFYPLGSEIKVHNIPIMQGTWNVFNKPVITYGKKSVVSPIFEHLYYVTHKNSTVFFVAVEYGLGHYHIFYTDEKTNAKLSTFVHC